MVPRREPVKPDRFVLGLAATAILLIVLSLASVIALQRQPAPPPDLTRPEGVVLAYLQTVPTGGDQTVQAFFSRRAQRELEQRRATSPGPRPASIRAPPPDGSQRVQLLRTRIEGDRAVVDVSITTFHADSPITPSEYTYQSSIPLVREEGQWKIDQADVPF